MSQRESSQCRAWRPIASRRIAHEGSCRAASVAFPRNSRARGTFSEVTQRGDAREQQTRRTTGSPRKRCERWRRLPSWVPHRHSCP
eukprot:207259-Pyramimonas_sp.AAC.2